MWKNVRSTLFEGVIEFSRFIFKPTTKQNVGILLQEDKRASRQSQVFQEFKKRTARAHSVMDEK